MQNPKSSKLRTIERNEAYEEKPAAREASYSLYCGFECLGVRADGQGPATKRQAD